MRMVRKTLGGDFFFFSFKKELWFCKTFELKEIKKVFHKKNLILLDNSLASCSLKDLFLTKDSSVMSFPCS